MQNFNVDISTSHIPQALYVKQGDSLSRFFALTIADNGSPWEPPENAAYTIRFSTSAGTGWYDTIQLVGGTTRPAVSAAGNVLTCEVAEQATLGNGQLCVMVNDATGYQLGTWNLNIIAEVVPGANSQEAESYYGVLAGQIAQALAAEQVATEQANLAKQYADSIDQSQFATQAELDATQAELDATQAELDATQAELDATRAQLAAKTTGHVIQTPDGAAMPQRAALQFVGFQVNDDPSGKTVVSPKTAGGTKNVAGYVGEISLFADNQLRENHVWADGSTINPTTWPDLAAYAATAGWETDSGTWWYKTPNLQGCFLLPSSAEYSVNTTGGEKEHTLTVQEMPAHKHDKIHSLQGSQQLQFANSTGSQIGYAGVTNNSGMPYDTPYAEPAYTSETGGGQPHNNMPPYYVVTAQIRAKVDIIEATAVEVNGNTLGGFEDGQVLAQQGGKIVGKEITAASLGAVQPYQARDSFTISSFAFNGFLTGANTSIRFCIPLCKPVAASSAAITGGGRVRQNGEYLFGTGSVDANFDTLDSVTATIQEGFLSINMTKRAGFGGTNNDTVSFSGTVTITFG